jgi:hypothetical protein
MSSVLSTSLWLLLAVLPPPSDGGAPPPEIATELSAEKVRLGEPFSYQVTVVHSASERWELRPPGDLGAFGLRSSRRNRRDTAGRSSTTFQFELALFELGAHVVPTLVFDVVGDGALHPASVAGPTVEGLSSLPPDAASKGAALMDIKPNEDVPVRSWKLLWGFLALAALVAGALWLRRYLASRRLSAPPPPPPPLTERTLAALEALREEGLLGFGLIREFHFRLSEILRGYLGERYGFEALECTSGELLNEVERLQPSGVDQRGLRRFVDQSDVAKFARAEIARPACDWALNYAVALVNATRPPPPVVATDAV